MDFPYGTMIVNIVGSFIMGLLISFFALVWEPPQALKAFLTVGLLGAMTTFSTFSLDTVVLFERNEHVAGLFYVALSVIASITALFAGMAIVRACVS
jgi:CrcB protein